MGKCSCKIRVATDAQERCFTSLLTLTLAVSCRNGPSHPRLRLDFCRLSHTSQRWPPPR